MTSKHLLANRLRTQIKQQYIWLIVLSAISAMLLGFLFHLLILPEFVENIAIRHTHNVYDYENYCEQLFHPGLTMVLFCGIGGLSALYSFSYLHSQKKVDYYHSQPVTLTNRFLSNIFVNMFCVILGLLINIVCDSLLFAIYKLDLSLVIPSLLLCSAFSFLAFLAGYCVIAFCTILTNNMIYTGLFAALLILGPILLAATISTLVEKSMRHLELDSLWLEKAANLSPITYFAKNLMFFSSICTDESPKVWTITLGIQILLILAFFVLAYIAFRFRNTERASLVTPFPWLIHIIRVVSMLAISSITFVFSYVFDSNPVLLAILSIAIAYFVVNFIIELNFKDTIKAKALIPSAIGILIYIGILITCNYDLLHIDSYVPDPSKVSYCTLDVRQGWTEAADTDKNDDTADECYLEAKYENVDFHDTAAVCNMVKQLLEYEKTHANYYSDFDNYDHENCNNNDSIEITYHMKNGSKVYRVYRYHYNDNNGITKEVIGSQEFLNNALPIISDDNYINDITSKFKYHGENSFSLQVSDEEDDTILAEINSDAGTGLKRMNEFKAAYREDLKEHPDFSLYRQSNDDYYDRDEIFHSDYLNVFYEYQNSDEEYDYTANDYNIPVPEDFTHTRAFISKYKSDKE
ncbi:MAG: ABC transporter permease [Lachnospiraceae bacterium]|nr:ABC transporter permease [Lachnospiraceae bacterium]